MLQERRKIDDEEKYVATANHELYAMFNDLQGISHEYVHTNHANTIQCIYVSLALLLLLKHQNSWWLGCSQTENQVL